MADNNPNNNSNSFTSNDYPLESNNTSSQQTNQQRQPDVVQQNQNTNPYGSQNYQQQWNDYGYSIGTEIDPDVNAMQTKRTEQREVMMKRIKNLSDVLIKRWYVIIAVVLLISTLVVVGYAIINRPSAPTGEFSNVQAQIEAPQSSPSGTPTRWSVRIQNKENVSIQQIEIKLNFDRAFRFLRSVNPDPVDTEGTTYRLSSLAPVGQGVSDALIQFEGVLTGNIDDETLMQGTLSYVPTPLIGLQNSQRSLTIAPAKTLITAPEVELAIELQNDKVQSGGEIELTVNFKNTSEKELRDLRLRLSYPDRGGFTYTSSQLFLSNTSDIKSQPDDGNNIWYISSLPRLAQQSLKLKGNVQAADGVRLSFTAEIGTRRNQNQFETLRTTIRDVTVTSEPLVLKASIEGKDTTRTFGPDEPLNVTIEYQNRSTRTLQNVEISGFLGDEAGLLDPNSYTFVGGELGQVNNGIVQWRPSGSPQLTNLTPQGRGVLRFTVKTKKAQDFLKSNLNQTAYILRPRAQARAANLDLVETTGEIYKAKGALNFTQKVEKLDPSNGGQANRRTYKITWSLSTLQNKVNDVLVEAVSPLPPTSWQQASITPPDSKIDYNPSTGKITFKPGTLEGYTGISRPISTVSFLLVVEESQNNALPLTNTININGVDDFTAEKYEVTNPGSAQV